MELIAGISPRSVEYAVEDAKVDIDELIAALEKAKEDGATHVVCFSGNYRGAQYVRLSTRVKFLDEDDL